MVWGNGELIFNREGRKGWLKLNIAVDADTGEIKEVIGDGDYNRRQGKSKKF